MSSLASDFDVLPVAVPPASKSENQLIQVRLGLASSLLAALRLKYAPAASHSLRVALGCSSWARAAGMQEGERDELEVAALLHDIGKIGAPDRLLLKPGALDAEESRLMDHYRLSGLDVLAHCCSTPGIVDIIRYSAAWYDGQRPNYPLAGRELSLGARMLAIVDAFDSMTTDQVYRQAMSRERAISELFDHCGTQFDPELVRLFCEMNIGVHLHQQAISRWLQSLDPRKANQFWQNTSLPASLAPAAHGDALFQQKLLDNMFDAVVFVDNNQRIIKWNRGAERLTGLSSESVIDRLWSPNLIGMCDETKGELSGLDCPISYCINTGVQSVLRLIVRKDARRLAVDAHTVPVVAPDGTTHGAAMLLHDASPQASLEEQCNNLHERATKDLLTQVANRAEFDRMHHLFVGAHLECNVPCSLIICDVDHFKSINDNYGHPAGDDVLRSFGALLKRECRSGDVVARYGGEEFVILCANCNNATAARRAEDLRRLASEQPQPALDGNIFTVSFGVTELQPGDTPESMLRRADRALLEAKRIGRNTVVQLGDGLIQPAASEPACEGAASGELMMDTVLVTSVPLNIAVEKLRGFVLDHHAEVIEIKADQIDLLIETYRNQPTRRRSDRPVPFLVELSFAEQRVAIGGSEDRPKNEVIKTRVRVSIRLKQTRDRRNGEIMSQAAAILAAIQSYLMATQDTTTPEPETTRRAVNLLAPWLKSRG